MTSVPIDQAASPLAVITGASSGIGLELAKQCAQHGFDLLVVAEDDGITRAADELRASGTQVDAAQIDLASYDGVEELYQRIQARGRAVDALLLNAGVGVGGPFLETDLDEELNLINLKIISPVHLAKRVVKDMVARRQGRVMFTSSIAAEGPGPFEAIYAASKAFLLSFSEALRNEIKDTGVTVTALQPGPTETNFFHRAQMDDTKVGASKKDDPADVARDGFDAMMKGKDHVVTHMFKTKAQAAMSEIMSEPAKAHMHRKESEPGSADQEAR